MGLVHGRELLIRSIRAIPLALLIALGCGRSSDAPGVASADSAAADVAPGSSVAPDPDVTLVGALPEGGPMPAPEDAVGIPPYPGASVHVSRPPTAEMRSFEAYTPDEWGTVVAWFDSQLGPPGWKRLEAQDMVIYQKGEDEAAITIGPWVGESLDPGVAEYMRAARTVIGVAWRP